MEQQTATITWNQFEETYKPIQNHVTTREEFNGWLFETYEADLEYINSLRETAPNTIWTILETDDYEVMIGSGYHYVNRLGYVVTEIPFAEASDISVIDEEDSKLERYKEQVVSCLDHLYGITLNDCDFTDEKLQEAMDEGQEPEELVIEHGNKYDLDRKD